MPANIKLTKQQLADLNAAERQLVELQQAADKAEACGDDCRAHKQNIANALERIRNYKLHFSK